MATSSATQEISRLTVVVSIIYCPSVVLSNSDKLSVRVKRKKNVGKLNKVSGCITIVGLQEMRKRFD